MLQAVMTKPGSIEFRDIAMVAPGPGQALVRIERIGVCGSDIHVYHGSHPYTSYPVVQGHEVSCVVVKTGNGVTDIRPGDLVTVQPQVVCGECYACRHGRYNICDNLKVMGFQTTGLAAEYAAIDESKLIKLPAGMDFDEGALVEPVAVAVHAVHMGGDMAGKKVLVLGGGPIGNLTAQVAKGLGASSVMITDISDYRLGIARECGIEHCVNPGLQDLGEAIRGTFGPDKADLILECVGLDITMEQAVVNARKGTDIIAVGVFGQKALVDLGLLQDRELRIIGTLMYRKSDFEGAVVLIEEKKIKLKPLITDHFDLQEYKKAYEFIEAQKDKTMKVLIRVHA